MDDVDQRLRIQLPDGITRANVRAQVVTPIVFDHDGQDVRAARVRLFLHGDDRTGYGGVNRGAKPGAVAHLLPHCDMLANLDQRLTGCADVLRHGDADEFR